MNELIEIRNLIEYAARDAGFESPDAGVDMVEPSADLVLERDGIRHEVKIRRLES